MNFRHFRARAVAASVPADLDEFVVALKEHANGSGHSVAFSRALEFDEEDRRLGLDTYCVSDSTGASAYGGVQSWELKRGALHMILTEACSREMGVAGYIVEYPEDREPLLREGLTRVIGK